VKDAFHDHIIPSHRPKEPEPERSPGAGLHKKLHGRKSPRLPPDHRSLEDEEDDEEEHGTEVNGDHETNEDKPNGDANGAAEQIVEPPPRPVNPRGARQFCNPDKVGTKAGAHYLFSNVHGKGGCVVVRLKMTPSSLEQDPSLLDEELFDDTIEERRVDADEFYGRIARGSISDDLRDIMRQALGGMLW